MECNPTTHPLNLFITTECSSNALSSISPLSATMGLSNWPLATSFESLEYHQFWRRFWGLVVWLCPLRFHQLHWHKLRSQLVFVGQLFGNPENVYDLLFFPFEDNRRVQWHVELIRDSLSQEHFFDMWSWLCERRSLLTSFKSDSGVVFCYLVFNSTVRGDVEALYWCAPSFNLLKHFCNE